MAETHETRLRRLRMRSHRRGTKEMDLILGPFSQTELTRLNPDQLDLYEALLEENDNDLYLWVTGARNGPEIYENLLKSIAAHALGRGIGGLT